MPKQDSKADRCFDIIVPKQKKKIKENGWLQYNGSWRPPQLLAVGDREQATHSNRASSPPLSPNVN